MKADSDADVRCKMAGTVMDYSGERNAIERFREACNSKGITAELNDNVLKGDIVNINRMKTAFHGSYVSEKT